MIQSRRTWNRLEQRYNPNFNAVESDHFKMQAGLPNFMRAQSVPTLTQNNVNIQKK